MKFICRECGKTHPVGTRQWRCVCGGLFDLLKEEGDAPIKGDLLGDLRTPVIPYEHKGLRLDLKLDFMTPTGSFKDRGAAFLVEVLAREGIDSVVEDSSGNAGAAIAAYCARAAIACRILVPESTSEGKLKQIKASGALLEKVPGSRDETQARAFQRAEESYYASHVFNPLFIEGVASMAEEILALPRPPQVVFCPVGNGTLLLGLHAGFSRLTKRPPVLMGVQARACAPVWSAEGKKPHAVCGPTLAEGIAVGKPARLKQILSAVKTSGGHFVTASEDEIAGAWKDLCANGIYCEPTSAAAVAAALAWAETPEGRGKRILVPLTGSGLKK